jgi:hypothetical protein
MGWSLLILDVCVCVCVCVFVASLFVLDGKMVDFGDDCSIILTSYAPGNYVDDALPSWKTDVQLWIEKKESLLVIFGTSMMILHNTTLQRPFPKLKKHHPTNLYMLYPMTQSVALVCVEIDKQMPPQGHCPLGSYLVIGPHPIF